MYRSRLAIACALAGTFAASLAAQPPANPADVATIEAIVRASYEVISGPAGTPRQWRRDSTLYAPGAQFVGMGMRDGEPRASIMGTEEYRRATDAGFVARGFIEHEIGSRIERFGNVAVVRSVYVMRRSADGPIDGRGVNYFTLYWDGSRWWIAGMVWDGERPANRIPEQWIGAQERVP